jgi:hypothetical protein
MRNSVTDIVLCSGMIGSDYSYLHKFEKLTENIIYCFNILLYHSPHLEELAMTLTNTVEVPTFAADVDNQCCYPNIKYLDINIAYLER